VTGPKRADHRHEPVYRVVRASWADPLDAEFSRRRPDNRWNTPEFAALYCCCSVTVARAVTRDLFRQVAVEPDDLQPTHQPRLAEIAWSGLVMDVATPEGIAAAGFPAEYPDGVSKVRTRLAATTWHAEDAEGVVCRSASLSRLGFTSWAGSHAPWGEVAVFVERSRTPPRLLAVRPDLGWLVSAVQ
jgi:RES domain-containing protein